MRLPRDSSGSDCCCAQRGRGVPLWCEKDFFPCAHGGCVRAGVWPCVAKLHSRVSSAGTEQVAVVVPPAGVGEVGCLTVGMATSLGTCLLWKLPANSCTLNSPGIGLVTSETNRSTKNVHGQQVEDTSTVNRPSCPTNCA